MTELLLAHGADPNARDGMGQTPLARAVQQVPEPGTRDRVLLLVRAGADVNARDHAGRSIAALAAEAGNSMVLPVLATLGVTDAQERMAKRSLDVATALMQAARGNHVADVRLLLAGGADPNIEDAQGETPLSYAARHRYTQVVEALLASGARVNAPTRAGSTALGLAAQGGHYQITVRLLAAGADADAKDAAGDTPLLIVAKSEPAVAGRWSAPGVGLPPLRGRSSGGTVEMDKALVQPGARTDKVILHVAPSSVLIMSALLTGGADPNAQDREGWTALMYAAARGQTEVVRFLLARGADVEIRAANGNTAETLATVEDVVRVLREARGRR